MKTPENRSPIVYGYRGKRKIGNVAEILLCQITIFRDGVPEDHQREACMKGGLEIGQ
jgi:hypothetical protein